MKSLRSVERCVGSEPTPPPVEAEPAEQEYYDEDDQQCVRVHGSTFLGFRRDATDFLRPPDCSNYGPEIDTVIGSENTYPPSSTADAVHCRKFAQPNGAGRAIEISAPKLASEISTAALPENVG